MSLQTTLRPIPEISADGAIVTAGSEDYAGGELMSQRHGGTDVLYGFSAEEILAACAPLPERLLLGYALQTGEDRRKSALARAIAEGLVALLPALFIMAALRYISDERSISFAGFVLIMLGVMGRAVWLEMHTPARSGSSPSGWISARVLGMHAKPAQTTACPPKQQVCYSMNWCWCASSSTGSKA